MFIYRTLKVEDLNKYEDDIAICFMDNLQITDSQSPLNLTNYDDRMDYLLGLLNSQESMVIAILDEENEYLYGLVVFDGIRVTDDGNAAQLHVAVCKDLWGKAILNIFRDMLDNFVMFNTLYCMLPAYCRPVISLVKKLGFKKTGYIPKALPYINIKGEEKMYDELIYTYLK